MAVTVELALWFPGSTILVLAGRNDVDSEEYKWH